MYARVTRAEGSGAWIDGLAGWLRETVLPAARDELDGFAGMLFCADREASTGLTITLWESEAALQASEARAQAWRDERIAALDMTVTGLDRCEVIVLEPAERRMARYARVTTAMGDPAAIDDAAIMLREKVTPAALMLPGNEGVMSLIDRRSGNGITLTFWESEEALRASEEAGQKLRQDTADTVGIGITGVDRCEVILDEPA